MQSKILIIVGPTASGKSALAVRLAKKLNGEIISADSRQVYKGLNVGTGKVTKKEMRGVPHHLLDVADAKKRFNVSDYKRLGEAAVKNILKKDKLPIIVGGTGFYIDAITGASILPEVPPNKTLRKKLEKKTAGELFEILKKKDLRRAKSIDRHNKVRLIRALEIVGALGKVPKPKFPITNDKLIFIGLRPEKKELEKKIYKRLIERLPGVIRETRKLPPKRAFELGLEYRFASLYLEGKLNKNEFTLKLNTAIRQYSKRQYTWFKRNKKIRWFNDVSSAYRATLRELAK